MARIKGQGERYFVKGSPRHRRMPNKQLAVLLGASYKPPPEETWNFLRRKPMNILLRRGDERKRIGTLFSTLSEEGRNWALSRLPKCLDKWEMKTGKRPRRGEFLFAMICRGLVAAWRTGIRNREESLALRRRGMGMKGQATRLLHGYPLLPEGFKRRIPKSKFSQGPRKSMTW